MTQRKRPQPTERTVASGTRAAAGTTGRYSSPGGERHVGVRGQRLRVGRVHVSSGRKGAGASRRERESVRVSAGCFQAAPPGGVSRPAGGVASGPNGSCALRGRRRILGGSGGAVTMRVPVLFLAFASAARARGRGRRRLGRSARRRGSPRRRGGGGRPSRARAPTRTPATTPAARLSSSPRGPDAPTPCGPCCAPGRGPTPPIATGGRPSTRPPRPGDAATARALLDAGATPDLVSRARGTALDVAERSRPRRELAGSAAGARRARLRQVDRRHRVRARPWTGRRLLRRGDGPRRDPLPPPRHAARRLRRAAVRPRPRARPAGRSAPAASAKATTLWVPGSCLTHTGVR